MPDEPKTFEDGVAAERGRLAPLLAALRAARDGEPYDFTRNIHAVWSQLAELDAGTPAKPPGTLSIYTVRDTARWGYSQNIVRAASTAEARAFVRKDHDEPSVRLGVWCEELREGVGILWCEDESPDTGGD